MYQIVPDMTIRRVALLDEYGNEEAEGWIMVCGHYTLFSEGAEQPPMPNLPEAHNFLRRVQAPVPPPIDCIKH